MAERAVLSLEDQIEERVRVVRANRLIRGACAGFAALCIGLAGGVVFPGVQADRQRLELVSSEAHYTDMPPEVTLPAAVLSTFRGFVVHVLWMRAEELKQEGKYFELQQLSDWICTLQPRFAKVWSNAAWNMSYNISVGTFTAEERWHWVRAGANLLRDKGLTYNPENIQMYLDLSWIYLHKMGDMMDDHHWDYKRAHAVEMEAILGQPPIEASTADEIAAIQVIADAADTLTGGQRRRILQADLDHYIAADANEPSMAAFVEQLADLGLAPDAALLRLVARIDRRDLQLEALMLDTPADHGDMWTRVQELLADPDWAAPRERLLAGLRAFVLSSDRKLDARFMVKLMHQYGPLDWRSVFAHGLYWAALGVDQCSETIGLDENVHMNINRYVLFGLKDSSERNRIILEPDFDAPFRSFIELLPDPRFIDIAHEQYLAVGAALQGDEPAAYYFREGPAGRHFKSGHVNFLHRAVRSLYLEGMTEKCKFYYAFLRENYFEPDGRTKQQYQQPVMEFVFQDLIEDLDSFKTGPVIMDELLKRTFLNLAYSRAEHARISMQMAREGYDTYMSTKAVDRNERRRLPPWPKFSAAALARFLLDYRLPRQHEMVMKARVWRGVDELSRLEVYRSIEYGLRERCLQNDPPLDFDKAFPAPPGLEEFEAARPPDEAPLQDATPEQGGKR